ncbi:hypothetical protein RchiOBHm_Chr2g0146511 [Rosa chinensis]|uniref:Uncharacterized protein n=1 Tax=Rosa chinensis TaxID=74649 RepID=A0A2P6RYX0_ROSCH|nr:hypothetical protein RchiOBHm_Chr2g0146511 [Rosa chinensis]
MFVVHIGFMWLMLNGCGNIRSWFLFVCTITCLSRSLRISTFIFSFVFQWLVH